VARSQHSYTALIHSCRACGGPGDGIASRPSERFTFVGPQVALASSPLPEALARRQEQAQGRCPPPPSATHTPRTPQSPHAQHNPHTMQSPYIYWTQTQTSLLTPAPAPVHISSHTQTPHYALSSQIHVYTHTTSGWAIVIQWNLITRDIACAPLHCNV